MSTAVYVLLIILGVFLALVAISMFNINILIVSDIADILMGFLATLYNAFVAFFQTLFGGSG